MATKTENDITRLIAAGVPVASDFLEIVGVSKRQEHVTFRVKMNYMCESGHPKHRVNTVHANGLELAKSAASYTSLDEIMVKALKYASHEEYRWRMRKEALADICVKMVWKDEDEQDDGCGEGLLSSAAGQMPDANLPVNQRVIDQQPTKLDLKGFDRLQVSIVRSNEAMIKDVPEQEVEPMREWVEGCFGSEQGPPLTIDISGFAKLLDLDLDLFEQVWADEDFEVDVDSDDKAETLLRGLARLETIGLIRFNYQGAPGWSCTEKGMALQRLFRDMTDDNALLTLNSIKPVENEDDG